MNLQDKLTKLREEYKIAPESERKLLEIRGKLLKLGIEKQKKEVITTSQAYSIFK